MAAYCTWLIHSALYSAVILLVGAVVVRLCRQPADRVRVVEGTLAAALLAFGLTSQPGLARYWLGLIATEDAGPSSAVVLASDSTAGGVQDVAPLSGLAAESTLPRNTIPARGPALSLHANSPRPRTLPLGLTAADALSAVAAAYVLGAGAMLARWALALRRLRHLQRSAQPAPQHAHGELQRIAGADCRHVQLLTSTALDAPITWGVRRPVIVLPAAALDEADLTRLRYGLAHEWAHVVRRDSAAWQLVALPQCLLYYQPLFWRLRRQLSISMDQLADAAAARQGASPTDYAAFLVGLARRRAPRSWAASLGVHDRSSSLRQRVQFLLEFTGSVRPTCPRRLSWAIAAASLAACCALTAVRLEADSPSLELPSRGAKESLREAPSAEDAASEVRISCVDEAGHPVAGAQVHLFQYSGGSDGGEYRLFGPYETDAGGVALCSEPAYKQGTQQFDRWIYARVPGRLVGVARSVRWPSSEHNVAGNVRLRPSQSVEGRVYVPAGYDVADVTVRVRVLHVITGDRDDDYEGLPRETSFRGLDVALPEVFDRQPDSEGRIRFDDVPVEGRLYLVTAAKGLGEAQWRNDGRDFNTDIKLTLSEEAKVSGRLLLPDGRPAEGAVVSARLDSSGRQDIFYESTFTAVTDADGRYLIGGLPDAGVSLSVQDPQQRGVVRPLESLSAAAGYLREVAFAMEPPIVVAGRVLDPNGLPVEGASLSALTDAGGAPLAHATSKADGTYQLRLPSGKAHLYFNALPPRFAYPDPQVIKVLNLQCGQAALYGLDFTVQQTSEAISNEPASEQNKSDLADGDEGSDLLRKLEAASGPILAALAQEHGYRLPPERSLARVALPFPPLRMAYYEIGHPHQAKAIPAGPSAMLFHWNGQALTNWGMTFGGDPQQGAGYDLAGVLDAAAGLKSQQLEGPPELLERDLPGDWIVRIEAEPQAIVADLQTILQKEFELPIKLEFREVEREVYVARGKYRFTPIEGQEGESETQLIDRVSRSDSIQIFGEDLAPDSGAGGGSGDFGEFLLWVGRWIEAPIVSEIDSGPQRELSWRLHGRSPATTETRRKDHDAETVLKNIARQTNLEFAKEKRKIAMLFIVEETP